MAAECLDGKLLAQQIKDDLKAQATALFEETGERIRLVNILVGQDRGASFYARSQRRAAEEIGIDYQLLELKESVSEMDVMSRVFDLNADPAVHGILIHKPLPAHIQDQILSNCVGIEKDIEGMNAANIGNILLGKSRVIPCTAAAVMEHLRAADVTLRGAEVVVVGASEIVGKPLSLLLVRQFATVTVCHIGTAEAGKLAHHVGQADVVVVAVGKPGLITGAMIKEGAVVIDVGINKVGEKIVGDVEFDSASARASRITPVPGGVGPLTVVMLMRNALEAFRIQKGLA